MDNLRFKRYVVTGVDVRGKRFRMTYGSGFWAMSINLWRGSVWGVSVSGKRTLLKRVYNR